MPYWRLSSYYLFYFASLGALVPYWGLYLQDAGFDPLAIGGLMAILTGTKIVAPFIWGHIVDHRGHRLQVVRLGSLLAVLGFATLYVTDGFWGMALTLLLFSFFWNASLPQMEALTFNHLRGRSTQYARVRIWGSVGFILVVVALGAALERGTLSQVPVWVLLLTVGICVTTFLVPDSAPEHDGLSPVSLCARLRQPSVLAFLGACFLMQASHGIYYAFYSIHLESAGYLSVAIGHLWALGVIAEVLIFLVMHRLLERFGARRVLLWSLALGGVRWILIGFCVDRPAVLFAAQWLHAATFGTFHVSAIHLVHHVFPGRTQGRGQALYNSVSFGAGGAVGNLIGGLLWTDAGASFTFGMAAILAVSGWFVAWRWMRGELYRH
ncbi:MFS transporter [Thermochromatium tepidum]|uniref:MFS transporter n=1 Tax=Thermochromatium tepidum ATCC 43061 TaxID=316276 RepID=A0A6I6E4U7_THETI|nr:MFS transporter [Thermochromatium tepidum]QGU31683.1 MFS transporter [Thermochromatium tepidum ATCC 43061]